MPNRRGDEDVFAMRNAGDSSARGVETDVEPPPDMRPKRTVFTEIQKIKTQKRVDAGEDLTYNNSNVIMGIYNCLFTGKSIDDDENRKKQKEIQI